MNGTTKRTAGNDPHASRLKEVLNYDPETGVFTWRVQKSATALVGQRAGCADGTGRAKVTIDGQAYRPYHLAWLYMIGEWPDSDIDHINRNPGDDRWANLRPATRGQNAVNSNKRSGCSSVYKGVWKSKTRWAVQCGGVDLGSFATEEDAARAYDAAVKEGYGEFARLNFPDG